MVLQNSSFDICVTKTPVKTPVTLESVLARIHKITRVRIKGNPTVALSLQTKVLRNTDVLKIDQENKMSRPCRHTSKHGIFHTPRCAVTADVPKILPLQLSRANNPVRHGLSVLACGPR